jgi:ABC-type iron transport system FetAB ATPase subunit
MHCSIFDELTLPARVSQARVDRVRLKHGAYSQSSLLKHRALNVRGGERGNDSLTIYLQPRYVHVLTNV